MNIILDLETHNKIQLESKPLKCPYCQSTIMPKPIAGIMARDKVSAIVFLKCINPYCEKLFTAIYHLGSKDYSIHQELAVAEQKFDDCINTISSSFVKRGQGDRYLDPYII